MAQPNRKPSEPPELPHNLEAEQRLLGAILVNNLALTPRVMELRGEHFYEPLHGRIFSACVRLIERGRIANPVTLKNLFEADENIKEIGGVQYLARLAGSAVTISLGDHYADIIHGLWQRRALVEAAEDLARSALEPTDAAADDIISAHGAKIDAIAAGKSDGGLKPLLEAVHSQIATVDAARRNGGVITGVTTGFDALDAALGGFQPGDFVVLGGRPSMGKTTLAVNIGLNAARKGHGVGMFSLEMTSEQIASLAIAEETGVSADLQRRAKVNDVELQLITRAPATLAALPFWIDRSRGIGVRHIRAHARRLKRQHPELALLVIDYLQLLRAERRYENRVGDITEITRGLKETAGELGLTIFALSQLSRKVEERDDKRPIMADLRESGSIEQDADIIMFIYRHEYYLRHLKPRPGEKRKEKWADWDELMELAKNKAEVIIAKQRLGAVDTVPLLYDQITSRFRNDTPANVADIQGGFL